MSEESIEKKAKERVRLFEDAAKDLTNPDYGLIPNDSVILRRPHLEFAANGYYILNKLFKKTKIKNGHNTEKTKIAALSALTIMTFQPFEPVLLDYVSNTNVMLANETLAMSVALGVLERDLYPVKGELQQRLLDIFTSINLKTLEPYISDIENGCIPECLDNYDFEIHEDDWFQINAVIAIMEFLNGKIITR